MSEQTFLRDAPYEFVPLLGQCKREKYTSHGIMEADTYTGKLKLRITIESPLHIGCKQQDYDKDGMVKNTQMRRNGKMIIPGSSLKGAVRSVAEAVSYSCAVKLPFYKLSNALPPGNKEPCSNIETQGLCFTCSIFGMANNSGGYRGKVNFGEFVLRSGDFECKKIPLLESPFKDYPERHDVFGSSSKKKSTYGNERLYYCRACDTGNCLNCRKEDYYENVQLAGPKREMRFRGRKFYNPDRGMPIESRKESYYELIKPQSVLEGEILFQNLKEEEGKLLAYSLGIGHQFTLKLGYGKPLGYGKVKIDLISAESITGRYPAEKSVDEDQFKQWAQDYKRESPADIQSVIKEFERIMN